MILTDSQENRNKMLLILTNALHKLKLNINSKKTEILMVGNSEMRSNIYIKIATVLLLKKIFIWISK